MKKLIIICLIYMVFSKRSVSHSGMSLVKQFEGCRLKAYKDSAGIYTIGYGTTDADRGITGKRIRDGMTITQQTADNWLEKSLNQKYAARVNKYDAKYKWTQNEFDALLSFAYNTGSIDKLTNHGKRNKQEIANAFLKYCFAGKKKLAGLAKRRAAERRLFLKK